MTVRRFGMVAALVTVLGAAAGCTGGADHAMGSTAAGVSVAIARSPMRLPAFRRGAQQAMTAAILRAPGNWYVMTACLRGPALATTEAAVQAMLRSVRLDPAG